MGSPVRVAVPYFRLSPADEPGARMTQPVKGPGGSLGRAGKLYLPCQTAAAVGGVRRAPLCIAMLHDPPIKSKSSQGTEDTLCHMWLRLPKASHM